MRTTPETHKTGICKECGRERLIIAKKRCGTCATKYYHRRAARIAAKRPLQIAEHHDNMITKYFGAEYLAEYHAAKARKV